MQPSHVDSVVTLNDTNPMSGHASRIASTALAQHEPRDDELGKQFVVDWIPNDPENPTNWTRRKKWLVTLTVVSLTGMSGATASFIASGVPSMTRALNSSLEENALTISMYTLGFAFPPLFLASFSEEWGRRPMYIVTMSIFTLFFLPVALAKNIQTVIVSRFIQGAMGSTSATLVGGSIADIWVTSERGLPMSVFTFTAIFATGLGPVIAGWIEFTVGWRWIEWLALIVSAVLTIWMTFYGEETRGSIVLWRRASRLREKTGDQRYQTLSGKPDMYSLLWISATRPLHILFTEPIAASFSIWLAFVWGVMFGLIESIGLVFETLYGFNPGERGLVFLSISVGACIGFLVNLLQERIYRNKVGSVGAEARLYCACGAAVTFVFGALIYAWTSFPFVHWIAPCIGITIIIASLFTIYLAVFNYLADAYLIYASSALAGTSLVRNLAATAFPLFTTQMYTRLNFRWASTLLGLIAALLAPVPLVLFVWGPKIRARSKFAQGLVTQSKETSTQDKNTV